MRVRLDTGQLEVTPAGQIVPGEPEAALRIAVVHTTSRCSRRSAQHPPSVQSCSDPPRPRFYGESSFLMYRKDVMEAKGITVPPKPTWQEVADIAAKVDGAQPGMKGICLRGQPGWGQIFAPLTTVVNTFGGTWFTADWQAQVNAPEFKEAVNFYVDLVRAHGEQGAPRPASPSASTTS